jgi:hypothetical protein
MGMIKRRFRGLEEREILAKLSLKCWQDSDLHPLKWEFRIGHCNCTGEFFI